VRRTAPRDAGRFPDLLAPRVGRAGTNGTPPDLAPMRTGESTRPLGTPSPWRSPWYVLAPPCRANERSQLHSMAPGRIGRTHLHWGGGGRSRGHGIHRTRLRQIVRILRPVAVQGGCGERRSGSDSGGIGRSGGTWSAVVVAVGRAEESECERGRE
jgi:hypothetical protein